MGPTGGFTGNLSPDAVHTAIDTAMYERYGRTQQPGYLRAEDSFFFKQGSTVGDSFIWDEDSNVGAFDETPEQSDVLSSDSFVGNTKTKKSTKFTKQVPISDEAFRADMIGKRNAIGNQIGDRARLTQDKKAILNTYGDVIAGAINTTPDGQALASNSHLTLKGQTVDNLETGAFTPDNAWTLAVSLANQKGQDGELGSHVFAGTVVPFLLYKTAKEVLDSSLIANSGENNLNIFETDYGQVQIAASAFLGSAYNGAANANTTYTFVGENHMIVRKVFYGLTTTMIDPQYTSTDSYVIRAKFNEVAFPGSWTGTVASQGTTA